MEVRESAWSRQYYRRALTLSAAFGGVPLVVLTGGAMLQPGSVESASPLRLAAIGAVCLILVPVIALLRRRMLGEGAGLHAVVDQAMVPQNRYRRMLRVVMVSMALCAVPALFGLALLLAGAGRGELYFSVAGSALLFALYVPRYAQWQGWFAQRSYFR